MLTGCSSLDVEETDSEYLVKTDLPDMKKEDVKVAIQDGVLSLEGERKQEKEEKTKQYHRVERSVRNLCTSVIRYRMTSTRDACKRSSRTACWWCTCRRLRTPSLAASISRSRSETADDTPRPPCVRS